MSLRILEGVKRYYSSLWSTLYVLASGPAKPWGSFKTGRVFLDQPEAEVGMFELGAFTQKEPPKEPKWVRFNLDTGAAQTAIPVDWK